MHSAHWPWDEPLPTSLRARPLGPEVSTSWKEGHSWGRRAPTRGSLSPSLSAVQRPTGDKGVHLKSPPRGATWAKPSRVAPRDVEHPLAVAQVGGGPLPCSEGATGSRLGAGLMAARRPGLQPPRAWGQVRSPSQWSQCGLPGSPSPRSGPKPSFPRVHATKDTVVQYKNRQDTPCPQRGRLTATATRPASCSLTQGPGPNQTCAGSPQGPWCPRPAKGTRTLPVACQTFRSLLPVASASPCGPGPGSLPRPRLLEVDSAIVWVSCRSASHLHSTCGPRGDPSVKICDSCPAYTWLARSQPGRPAAGGASRSQGTHGGPRGLRKTPWAGPRESRWAVAPAPQMTSPGPRARARTCRGPSRREHPNSSSGAAETPAARWLGAPSTGPPRHEGGQSAEASGPQLATLAASTPDLAREPHF